jgi:aminopeptidase N
MTWYSQAGTPEVVCSLTYDARGETAQMRLTQTQAPTPGEPRKKPLHIPIRLGLIDAKGREMALVRPTGERLSDGLIELRKRSEKFRFHNVEAPPVVSLLRDFSAPVNLRIERSDAELAFLMAHDSDLFNRWQAAQDYAARVLAAAVAARIAGGRAPAPGAFIDALAVTLSDTSLAPGYVAEVLKLPTENDLARIIGKDVDPLAIHRAREALRKAIATRLYAPLLETYRRMATPGPYSPAPEPAGRRTLRNVALGYLTARGRPEDVALAARHFKASRNLTDETAALGLLAHTNTPERAAALERFYRRWKGDHLVIDSWFAVQASSPLPGTLAAVRRLTQHPLFSIKNPNKVRALIGQFAVTNAVNFNRPDGKGYDLVADRVLELDTFNPQMAARILSAFRGWRMLEPKRRAAAKRTLQRVAKTKPLSNDVFEIVSKMLE